MSSTTIDPASADGGLFIVFEGVEGAGKSTQVRRIAERLNGLGVPHRLVREPGGTEVGERIREIVLDPALVIGAEAELLLVLAARAESVRRLVRPALAAGELVLSDRYELSTFAYQGAGRGLGIERTREWNRLATEGLVPHLTILLLVGSEVGRSRQSGEADRLERERDDFHRTVAAAYERLAAMDETIVTIRAEGTADETHEAIWAHLTQRWPDRFGNFSSPNEFHEGGTARGGSHIETGEAGEDIE